MAPVEYAFVGVGARDPAAADAVVELLRRADLDTGSADVVSLGRKRNMEVRFHSEAIESNAAEPEVSIAAGLAAALYPSVGADFPASQADQRAALNAVAGRVASAVGRPDLMRFGELLDASSAAVIAVVPLAARDDVVALLGDCDAIVVCTAVLDTDALARAASVARTAAGPRGGPT